MTAPGTPGDRLPTTPGGRRLVDATEAAAVLGVPASWVRAQARAGRLPAVHLGRYVRFDLVELERWWQETPKLTRRSPP